jgi:two-component system nitrogen regulation response regulator NtrX
VIAATNKNLEKEIAASRFREDLYYRLNVIPFQVPPLRERREDIEILARRFVQEFCAESGEPPRELTPECLAALEAHAWPGNVRELRNLIERLVIMTPGPRIDVADLPGGFRAAALEDEEEGGRLSSARRGFEREYLLARLREHGWNISRTAEAIGIARESLSRKIKAHKIGIERV